MKAPLLGEEEFDVTVEALSDLVAHQRKDALEALGGLEGVAEKLKTNTKNGLSQAEADQGFAGRRKVFGENRYPEPPKKSLLSFFWESLQDLTMIILIVCAVVSLVIALAVPKSLTEEVVCSDGSAAAASDAAAEEGNTEWIEGVAILIAVLVVTLVTTINNYSKELKFRALAAKEKDVSIKVKRAGAIQSISIFELNVGDVVIIDTGDQLPADGIFITGYDLRVDESQMNGEPVAAKKNHETPFLLSGTKVTDGSGEYLATAVGSNSEWGKTMASLHQEARPTPLQENLDDMATLIGKFGMAVAALVFVVLTIYWLVDALKTEKTWKCPRNPGEEPDPCYDPGDGNRSDECVYTGYDWAGATCILDFFITAVTIIVMAVPEGLPLAVTISLAYSMKQMFKDNNLVRHLKACETMSNCTNICSDKTGTLTENRMTVVEGWVADDAFEVVPPPRAPKEKVLAIMKDGISMNSAQTTSFREEPGKPLELIGNKTECALLVFLNVLGFHYEAIRHEREVDIVQRFPFSSAKKRMSTIMWANKEEGIARVHTKGAPEMIMKRSLYYLDNDGEIKLLTQEKKDEISALQVKWANKALRTLCLAYRDIAMPKKEGRYTPATLGVEDIDLQGMTCDGFEDSFEVTADPEDGSFKFAEAPESRLIIYAVVGIQDPVRPEVPGAVADCVNAGITVRMVTGDNIATAKSIARGCHILSEDGIAMEGPDFANTSDEDLEKIIDKLQVIARCSPTDKQRLVHFLIERGEVVAVTGDGTNDVPALKEADVGLAMGIRGTDIAKQASDIVILDDNFLSIVKAVMWGRNVYDNIRKFLQFQLTVNFAACMVAFIGAVSRMGTPLKAIQLLWVNLIMDTFAALALGTEKPTNDLLKRKPFGRFDSLLSPYMLRFIIGQGIYQICVLLVLMYTGFRFKFLHAPCAYASRNAGFTKTDRENEAGELCTNDEIDHQTTVMETLIFNSFVFCQIFNMINARRVNGEKNVYKGMFTNMMFIAIMAGIIAGQVVIMLVAGEWMQVAHRSDFKWYHWVTSLAVGAFTLVLGAIINFIPVPKVEPKKKKEDAKGFCGIRVDPREVMKEEAQHEEEVVQYVVKARAEGTSINADEAPTHKLQGRKSMVKKISMK